MSFIEIVWSVALVAPTFKVGWGWIMIQYPPFNFSAARLLFLASPLGPLIGTGIWAFTEAPTLGECLGVSAIVGGPMAFLVLESLRWLDSHESRHRDASSGGES